MEQTPEALVARLQAENAILTAAVEDWHLAGTTNVADSGCDLVNRLRGLYRIQAEDGVVYERRFVVNGIQQEAAAEIVRLRDENAVLMLGRLRGMVAEPFRVGPTKEDPA